MLKMSKKKGNKRFRNHMKNKRRNRAKNIAKINVEEPDELKRAPHSFVIHRGTVGRYIMELEKNFRRVMDPYTASSLQVLKKNSLKDFVSISGLLKVSHLVVFTNSAIGPYMRIARLPQGPTLMFRVQNYSLCRDVVSSLKTQMTNKKLYSSAPLIILNNFTGEAGSHIQLMASVFQNMFPTINVTKVKLADIRRCVLLNYNEDTKCVDFRHFAIRAVPVGVSRGVKKIVQSKIPNLSKYEYMEDFLTKPNLLSESEGEDDPNSVVEVPQKLAARGNVVSQKSSIRLSELGPRMTLQLIKIEDGLMNGEVMYHELVQKTEAEKRAIKKMRLDKKKLKEKRRKEQEENVRRKEQLKNFHKEKSLEGIRKRSKYVEDNSVQEDDDAEYFRQEVGRDPDDDMFSKDGSTKSGEKKEFVPSWKKKKAEKTQKVEDGSGKQEKLKRRVKRGRVDKNKKYGFDGGETKRGFKGDKFKTKQRDASKFKSNRRNSGRKNLK